MFHQTTDNDAPRLNKILKRFPMSKVGSPEDIGSACISLGSKAASYI